MAEYAVIIPTLNEVGNVRILAERLEKILRPYDWELVFVDDDSRDGTLDELRHMAKSNPRIRFIRRVGRRGLASACIEGMLATTATYLAVIDADLQHDESKIPELFALLDSGQATVAVASRYAEGGGMGEWSKKRQGMSKLATFLSKVGLEVPCSDPMSGFFAIHRQLIDTNPEKMHPYGFKILYDFLSRRDLPLKVREVPYVFGTRQSGSTKLTSFVMLDFLWLLLAKHVQRFISPQFVLFCFVGLLGLGMHMAVLFVLHRVLDTTFLFGQTAATLCAMTFNYLLNNIITFPAQRLRGAEMLLGYGKFVAGCTIGAFANIGTAYFLQKNILPWLPAAAIGVGIGAIINYSFSKLFVWKS